MILDEMMNLTALTKMWDKLANDGEDEMFPQYHSNKSNFLIYRQLLTGYITRRQHQVNINCTSICLIINLLVSSILLLTKSIYF